jgi:branched-subunit amino acid transport protein AzlD
MLVNIIIISLIVLTIAIFALPHLIFSKNKLPQPSGKWQVGTTD